MGQVSPGIEVETHERVARLQEREEDGLVHLRTRVGLDVDEVDAEQLLGALDGKLFGDIDELAAAIITLARITFGILVGHDRALGFEHGARDDVLRCNQLDLVTLTTEFLLDRAKDFRVGFGERAGEECFGIRHEQGSWER
ncbi:hypothetical protein D3C80_499570 [compost metagenome]